MKVYEYKSISPTNRSSSFSIQTSIRDDSNDYSQSTMRISVDEPVCSICLETFSSGEVHRFKVMFIKMR